MANLAKPQHLRKQTQNKSQFSHRITELETLLGISFKWGLRTVEVDKCDIPIVTRWENLIEYFAFDYNCCGSQESPPTFLLSKRKGEKVQERPLR